MVQHQQDHTTWQWYQQIPAPKESYNVALAPAGFSNRTCNVVLAPTCSSTNRIIQCGNSTNIITQCALAPIGSSTKIILQCGAGTQTFQCQQNTYKSQQLMSQSKDRLDTGEEMIKHIHYFNWEAQSLTK
jgi:hypothetical protein